MRKKFLIAALVLMAPTAEAGNLMEEIMKSWVGGTLDQAIVQWGYPEAEKVIAGRKLYTWKDDKSGFGNLVNCERTLQVNQKEVVVGTDWDGNNCPFMEVFHYKKWRRKK